MDKCPFCGAELISLPDDYDDYVVFLCGTSGFSCDLDRKSECYERQIDNLKELLKAWREFGLAWHGIHLDSDHPVWEKARKLKDQGEI